MWYVRMLEIWLLHNNIKYIKIISNINKLLFEFISFRIVKIAKMGKGVETTFKYCKKSFYGHTDGRTFVFIE